MQYEDIVRRLASGPTEQLEIGRAGLATLARLGADLFRAGRAVALLVPDRAALEACRALIGVFLSETSGAGGLSGSGGSPEYGGSGGEGRDGPGSSPWIFLPPFTGRSLNRAGWARRLAALHDLRQGYARGVVLTADNLIPRWMPLDFFEGQELRLVRGEEISPDMVIDQAVDWGYERVSMVANPGEIARRGDILDIMPPGYSRPLRLDFFGDSIDGIRLFDPASQRSRADLAEALILPVRPLRRDKKSRAALEKRWKTLLKRKELSENEHFGLTRLLEEEDFRLLPGSCSEKATLFSEWLPKDCLWLLPGRAESEELLRSASRHWQALLTEADSRPQPARLALREPEEVSACWNNSLSAEALHLGVEKPELELPERRIDSFADLFPAAGRLATSADGDGSKSPVDVQDRPWQALMQILRRWQTERRRVVLVFSTDQSRAKFLRLAEQDGLFPSLRYDRERREVCALVAPFRSGAELRWDETFILGEDVLQPRQERGRRAPSGAFRGLDRHEDLNPGDLLVHRDYGIARFGGLLRMDVAGTANDFLLLYYAGDDKLYVPVDRLSLIQRFKGGGETPPPLDRLGGGSWQAGRDKARKAIEKVAEDLVEMYAWRRVAKGFHYPPVGELYREFEASFGFEETPDQARAIHDVLMDMEKPEPMDRLVCGDVGFGKTEVALRAAFRAASEGRQVVLLCPTTVLAEQHYQTFRSRLSPFAINVGLLSRFVPAAKQKETLKAAASGQIDILVGTHRLLSSDVKVPNLALLILDEEQRFGVRHKEKLKAMRKNVDVLTLTATPIPRTLQLSMSGVRELSLIETAPLDRKPVSTAILQRDKATLRQILERELARQGQVFWVYNRVQGLEQVASFVRELAPQARVGMAHGQMPEKALEETMHAFWHGELDVLVCTAIVESGLDFPRANTLVVDQAQMFGLGQLYQLRGRVGRSDRQAFAVFVVPDPDRLPEATRERLRIILDIDYLGGGFQIAMEDLRLRGAGNLLGEVQSGHMNRVGLDLYLEMLEEAVARIRGSGVALQTETELNLALTAHIPESYISDARERLRWYKRLSSAPDAATRHDLSLELRDRFGRLPEELEAFIAVLELKSFLAGAQAVRADVHPERLRLFWNAQQTAIVPERLPAFLAAQKGRVRLLPPATLEIRLDTDRSVPERLDEARRILTPLLSPSGS